MSLNYTKRLSCLSKYEQMELLFNVYYNECPSERIRYTDSVVRQDGYYQSWIVMKDIELSFMLYQGRYQAVFMFNRDNETYYFNNYQRCREVFDMDDDEFSKYIDTIINFF